MHPGFTPQQYGHLIALSLALLVLLVMIGTILIRPGLVLYTKSRTWPLLVVLIAVLMWQILDLFAGIFPEWGRPAFTMTLLMLACLTCGSTSYFYKRDIVSPWMRPLVHLSLAGIVFSLGVHGISQDNIPVFEESEYQPLGMLLGATNHQLSDKQAYTDRGRVIALYTPRSWPVALEKKPSDPSVFWPEHAFGHKLIRTAPPDPRYNCFGWVFTAGQYILAPDDVQRILEDNGYYEVHEPEPNDVVVYYDQQGMITHTALVRAVGPDGFVLVESKWGISGGRYLHLPELWFSARQVYYRSHRGSHLLKGLEPARSVPVAVRPW
ncbi:MAG: hypothetical protein RMI91_05585 [Gemmatales bacterium]|nr:hypothetical protein [Gemmatales bacterium]MDW7994106.1 hypothetical protein [Gemmatales bacterium]